MTYDFVEKKFQKMKFEIEKIDENYVWNIMNDSWINERKPSYIILQGILRRASSDTIGPYISPETLTHHSSNPDSLEHLIVIDTCTGVYIDHFARNKNGKPIHNDVNDLHLTNSKKVTCDILN